MLALVLATLSSAGFSISIRFAQRRGANLTVVGAVNYLTAVVFHLVLTIIAGVHAPHGMTVAIGAVGGITFSWAYFLLFAVMKQRGVSITAAIMGLSVLVPVGFSFLAWGEGATPLQTVGIAIAIISLPLLSIGPQSKDSSKVAKGRVGARGRAIISLAGLFLVNGTSLVAARAFRQTGIRNEDPLFLLIIFTSATITTLVIWAAQERALRRGTAAATAPAGSGTPGGGSLAVPLLFSAAPGVIVGLCNALSNRFIVMSLHSLPGIIVYPFYSAVGLVVMVAFSRIAWKEKISPMEMIGMGLACSSIVLINLV
jgi:drug/metabolite transporter (DMT)-like permease